SKIRAGNFQSCIRELCELIRELIGPIREFGIRRSRVMEGTSRRDKSSEKSGVLLKPGIRVDGVCLLEGIPTVHAVRTSSRERPDTICQSSSREAGDPPGWLRRYLAPGKHSGKPC